MELYTFMSLLLASFIGTLVMTLFSYLLSDGFKELYKEPVLLTYFIHKLNLSLRPFSLTILAWLLHLLIGFVFVLAYHFFWHNNLLELNLLNSLLLGAISGFIGILGWTFIFNFTNYEPKIDFYGYFFQLFFAHIIFGLSAFLVYIYL
ncbi:hypothetical protein [Flavobacterium sp. UMI-01]|uniref:hypothetical protein n=1 Tax=Flavobacterium sp. UMI-01 TaxID=1441053 RepID=UPI001C7CBB3A|nr:hypothetical protein [Flavobacterium sp. UMI-01]GIZ09009.1 hypothetical protein FUMI01_17360 [Flavobacterium sp. UMI-01]